MSNNILYLLAVLIFGWLAYLVFDYIQFTTQREKYIQEQGEQTTIALRDRVNELLLKIAAEGQRLADDLGNGSYNRAEIETKIAESALSIPEIQGVTACFEPYAFAADTRLYCPYYNKGTQDYLFVGQNYDYTQKEATGTAWYTEVRDQGARWVEPYFAQVANDWYVDYGVPFYYSTGEQEGQVKGTITMSFVLSGFQELIHSLALGKTGYGLITSSQGTILAHPVSDYIGTTRIDSIITADTPLALGTAYSKMRERQRGNVQFYDTVQQNETLFYYDKIPAADWGMGLIFYKDDLLGDSQRMRRKHLRLALAVSLLFVCLLAIYFNKDHLDEREIWILSGVSSVLLISNILLVGYLQHSDRHVHEATASSPITEPAALETFVYDQQQRAEELKLPTATVIPTGIYVERLEFADSYNLNVSGKIWQKYPLDLLEQVEVGFSLPQLSPFAESAYVEEIHREQINAKEGEMDYWLIHWDIRVTLRLNLSYSDYPLDKRHVNIELQPLNAADHLLFVPDLASYQYTNPFRKSGLSPAVKISGSEVIESYFNFSLRSYDSDFGFNDKSLFAVVPVLHFNIHTRRILLNAFVTYLIPIFVTLIMVFILIYACHKTQERQGIIESMAAFFFVLIFSHIDMRREIITADLIYLEYFYFTAYFLLIAATANLIVYTKDRSHIFDYNDNQIFKAVYFPAFFLIILIVSWVKFY